MVNQTGACIKALRKRIQHIIRMFGTIGSVVLCCITSFAAGKPLVVDLSGRGDFKSIQEAINSLPDMAHEQRVIYIRNGVYREKVFIEKSFITLIGEDKTKTILSISQARDAWRCSNPDDWGVATLNLTGTDIVLENLSVINSYGFDNTAEVRIECPSDSINHFKMVRKDGHQMALRSFGTTRLIVRNCILRAFGGDTVSPWNVDNGMFYFKDCLMEGGGDFYCPRGWAYAENCEFVAHGKVAAIWHDGSAVKDSKTVLVNCRFRGDDGFKLGRYHRDAQFYLINCSFAANMADAPVYLNPSNPQNIIRWGQRVYFYNCHRDGTDYPWYADNLTQAEGSPTAAEIDLNWTFAGKWKPSAATSDPVADNMLVYQRAIGGWPKALNEVKVDYNQQLSGQEKKDIRADSLHNDATIDNQATTREIRYLVKAYRQTDNPLYLYAAEKGIRYLLMAQNMAGGWPQYYPDSSSYRSQITYNDDAMINVLNVLQDLVEKKNGFEVVNPSLVPQAQQAVQRGIQCILATQIIVKGKLTAWCAQYNKRTLQPEMARKFELVSISGFESVGIVRFLMRIKNPSPAVRKAINAAVDWLEAVKIKGYRYVDIVAPHEPKGKDRIIEPDPESTIWARFYEIGTNRPFFSGRDSNKKYSVAEIEVERRTGYAWYGTWPGKLLNTEYPAWKQQNKN